MCDKSTALVLHCSINRNVLLWVTVVVLCMSRLPKVQPFSAQLTRPWEALNAHPLERRQHFIRVYVSKLEKDGENKQSKNDDKEQQPNDDDEGASSSSAHEKDPSSRNAMDQEVVVAAAPMHGVPHVDVHSASSGQTTVPTKVIGKSLVTPSGKPPLVKDHLKDLISMTRPANDPGVVLFHMLGVYLAIQGSGVNFWKMLLRPTMMLTLLSLVLTSSTSMLVNDYYDFKLGNDSNKVGKPIFKVPLPVAKKFTSYLYGAALLVTTMLPGVPARMAVICGLMLTFYYTQHLKPRTWLKNVVCASLIALSPLTSGFAAAGLLNNNGGSSSILGLILSPALLRLVSMLFVGILGREITMDMNDLEDDSQLGIRTVPVVYGRKFASRVALICSLGVVGLSMASPMMHLWSKTMGGGGFGAQRRLAFASVGSLTQLWRSWQVYQTEGQNKGLNARAIDEGLLTVVLLLASYI